MKVLVYGSGVIGCELAHVLIKANNDVTMLARNKWRDTIEENGLIIRHYVQMHTTIDRVATITKLEQEDVYDLIFVVMQYGQIEKVLPFIAANRSRYVVLVGNNMSAKESVEELLLSETKKEVAFGFQATGGRRENGRVISVHAGVGMTIGGAQGPLSGQFRNYIESAFSRVRYRLTWEENMDAWLKCHLAFILPITYVCFATKFSLGKSTSKQRNTIINAAIEGFELLKKIGYPIRPVGSEETMLNNRWTIRVLLWFMAKTPLGRLAASDHCKNAAAEMIALDTAFENMRELGHSAMPNWDILRNEGKPH